MPWCPKCRYEYRDEFTVCNNCEVELVNVLEPLTRRRERNWNMIRTGARGAR